MFLVWGESDSARTDSMAHYPRFRRKEIRPTYTFAAFVL